MWQLFLEYWYWFTYYTTTSHLTFSRFSYLRNFITQILIQKQTPENKFDRKLSKLQFQLEVCLFLTKERLFFQEKFSYINVLKKWLHTKDTQQLNWTDQNIMLLDIILSDLAEGEVHSSIEGYLSPHELLKTKYLRDIWKSNNS